MKSLLLALALILSAGCTQPNDGYETRHGYVVAALCGSAACPFMNIDRDVYVTENLDAAKLRFIYDADQLTAVNPDPETEHVPDLARRMMFGAGRHPALAPGGSASLTVNIDGGAASFYLTITYTAL